MPWTDIEYIALSKVNELRGIISDKNSRIKKLKSQLESQENELRFFRNAFPNAAHNWQKAAQQSVHPTVLPVREIEIICPNCNLVIDVPVPAPHSG